MRVANRSCYKNGSTEVFLKNILFTVILAGLSSWGGVAVAQNAPPKMTTSLSQVRSNIDSPNGKAIFDQQMSGATRPNGFGTDRPSGVTFTDIVRLILPQENAAFATLVGIKRWPLQQNLYVAFVCLAPTVAARNDALQYNNGQPICSPWQEMLESSVSGKYRMAVAVLQLNAEKRLALASNVLSWSGVESSPLGARWKNSNLFGPLGINDDEDKESHRLKEQLFFPSDLYKFDLANYAIAEGQVAFGLRSGLNESYSGGGANFQILTLFAMVDGELRVIFSEPMYAFKDVAGEWNKDRTRQHHVYESENTLRVAQTAHHGYFDLIVQAKKKGSRKVFQWDPRVRRYVALEIKHSP